jgi:hypothetical protein
MSNAEKKLRELIKQMVREMTTTAAVPGYQTPYAFSTKGSDDQEEDVEEFLDTYGWELAEEKMNELTPEAAQDLKAYFDELEAMRDDPSSYKTKSNYLPHNVKEMVREELETILGRSSIDKTVGVPRKFIVVEYPDRYSQLADVAYVTDWMGFADIQGGSSRRRDIYGIYTMSNYEQAVEDAKMLLDRRS